MRRDRRRSLSAGQEKERQTPAPSPAPHPWLWISKLRNFAELDKHNYAVSRPRSERQMRFRLRMAKRTPKLRMAYFGGVAESGRGGSYGRDRSHPITCSTFLSGGKTG